MKKNDIAIPMLRARKYAFVCGLGDTCAVAEYMKRVNVREMSGPFDWNGLPSRGLVQFVDTVVDDFREFLLPERLVKIANPGGAGDDLSHDYYKDTVTGHLFYHDFPLDSDLSRDLPVVKAKYDRRIARFRARMRDPGRVLFVFSAKGRQPTDAEMVESLARLRRHFAREDIDLLVLPREAEGFDGIRIRALTPDIAVAGADYFGTRYPAFTGNVPAFMSVMSQIRTPYKRKQAIRQALYKMKVRFLAAFILNHDKRKAYRRQYINTHD